jgi:adenosylcobinamide amidohydrolase
MLRWETLAALPLAELRRSGRFIVVDLEAPHLVLSTSAKNGGQTDHVRHLVNHQSCEGSGHESRSHAILTLGPEAYHDEVCLEIGIPPSDATVLSTAANMNYAAIAREQDDDVEVLAAVTAGVRTNAVCAGDPASWRESRDGIVKVPPVAGTINTMLVVSQPVHPAALARLVVNLTEAKSAALQQLAVPSCYSADLATGTGTDQFSVAAPRDGRKPLTSASPHMKFGEIVGRAVRAATVEALRWQNGLEPSYTRGVFHALGRYGLKEQTIFDDLAGLLDADHLQLLHRNANAVFYEPLVGAAAYALAAVLDRARHQALPGSVLPEAIVQQAATLAASLAATPHRWPDFHSRLRGMAQFEPKALVLAAIALGWHDKWRPH